MSATPPIAFMSLPRMRRRRMRMRVACIHRLAAVAAGEHRRRSRLRVEESSTEEGRWWCPARVRVVLRPLR